MKNLRKIAALIVLATMVGPSCSMNLLSEFGGETNESLLFEAEELMNSANWSGAIAKFGDLSSDFRARRDVRLKEAKAYVGRCGLDFLSLAESLMNGGATSLFGMLMVALTQADAAAVADCVTAEALILQIGAAPAARTADENVTLAFVEFAKIGSILSLRADPDGNGVANWADNGSCTVGNGSNDFLTDLEAGHLATGMAIAVASLSAAGSSIGGGALSSIDAVCTALGGMPALNFCGLTDPTALTAPQLLGIRTVVQEGTMGIGLGTCTDSPADLVNCLCL